MSTFIKKILPRVNVMFKPANVNWKVASRKSMVLHGAYCTQTENAVTL